MADKRNLYLDVWLPQRQQLWQKAWELAVDEANTVAAKQQIRVALLKDLDKEITERQKLLADAQQKQAAASSDRELQATKLDQAQHLAEFHETNENRRATASNKARLEAARISGNAVVMKDVLESLHAEYEANLREKGKGIDKIAGFQESQGVGQYLDEPVSKLIANPADKQALQRLLQATDQTIGDYDKSAAFPSEVVTQKIAAIPNENLRLQAWDYVRGRLPEDQIARFQEDVNYAEYAALTSGQRKAMLADSLDLPEKLRAGLGGRGSVSVGGKGPVGAAGEVGDATTPAGDRVRAVVDQPYVDDQLDKLIAERNQIRKSVLGEQDVDKLPRARQIFRDEFSGTKGIFTNPKEPEPPQVASPSGSLVKPITQQGVPGYQPPMQQSPALPGPPGTTKPEPLTKALPIPTPGDTHAQGILTAMKAGNELVAQPNRFNRLLANDPIAAVVSRSYNIDQTNSVPLMAQVDKLMATYAGDATKQQRAVSMLFAINNQHRSNEVLTSPSGPAAGAV